MINVSFYTFGVFYFSGLLSILGSLVSAYLCVWLRLVYAICLNRKNFLVKRLSGLCLAIVKASQNNAYDMSRNGERALLLKISRLYKSQLSSFVVFREAHFHIPI